MVASDCATFGFTFDGSPAAPATVSTFIDCSAPVESLYWKIPCCARGLSTVEVTLFVAGWIDVEKVPKKNSLSLRIGPPTDPPNSFSLMIFRGWLRALFSHELAFRAVLR